jgi:hypothetical protein
MSKYQVEVHHIIHSYDYYEIEAESPEEARDRVNEGDGEYMFSNVDEPEWESNEEAYVTGVFNEEGNLVL